MFPVPRGKHKLSQVPQILSHRQLHRRAPLPRAAVRYNFQLGVLLRKEGLPTREGPLLGCEASFSGSGGIPFRKVVFNGAYAKWMPSWRMPCLNFAPTLPPPSPVFVVVCFVETCAAGGMRELYQTGFYGFLKAEKHVFTARYIIYIQRRSPIGGNASRINGGRLRVHLIDREADPESLSCLSLSYVVNFFICNH